MKQAICSYIVVIIFALTSCGTYNTFQRDRLNYTLGDKTISLIRIQTKGQGPVYFNMHEDEDTSVKALKKYLRKHDGVLYYLKHDHDRTIDFQLNSNTYVFDPNRIFTSKGIERTMKTQGHYDNEGHVAVDKFAKTLLSLVKVKDQSFLITLHNNTEDRYSITSYISGGQYEQDAKLVHKNELKDHDDFYFVTDEKLYELLKRKNENVILQNTETGVDDGSLSIYCGYHNVRYVNVEAQRGHKRIQLEMYKVLGEILIGPYGLWHN